MPHYTYTGDGERALFGLIEGTNARRAPRDPDDVVPEGTVVVRPGDVIETDEPYEHAQLVEFEPEAPPAQPAESVPEDVPEKKTPARRAKAPKE